MSLLPSVPAQGGAPGQGPLVRTRTFAVGKKSSSRFLDYPDMPADNNYCEQTDQEFCDRSQGGGYFAIARVGANFQRESVLAGHDRAWPTTIEPFAYLSYLFDQLPTATHRRGARSAAAVELQAAPPNRPPPCSRLEELREHTWNPAGRQPRGQAIYMLLAQGLRGRLPDRPANRWRGAARGGSRTRSAPRGPRSGGCPRFTWRRRSASFGGGDRGLVTEEVNARACAQAANSGAGYLGLGAAARLPAAVIAEVEKARPARTRGPSPGTPGLACRPRLGGATTTRGGPAPGFADPRLGRDMFARQSLSLTPVLRVGRRRESWPAPRDDLERLTDEIAEVGRRARRHAARGARPAGAARRALTRATILAFCADAPRPAQDGLRPASTTLVHPLRRPGRGHRHAGDQTGAIAVALLRPARGRFEARARGDVHRGLSPTPKDWTAERVASFYREYKQAHGAQPDGARGDARPLPAAASTRARFNRGDQAAGGACGRGPFVEGWAVYAEELMARHEYPGEGDPGGGAHAAAQDAAAQW